MFIGIFADGAEGYLPLNNVCVDPVGQSSVGSVHSSPLPSPLSWAEGAGQRIGLIAGNGRLPLIFAQALGRRVAVETALSSTPAGAPPSHPERKEPLGVVAIGHEGETEASLAEWVEDFRWVRLGQFKRILDFFLRHNVKWVVMAGGITKSRIWRARPDFLALKMVLGLRHLHDDLLLRTATTILEEYGFILKSVTDFVPELLAPAGVLSRRQPTQEEWVDIRFGWWAAKSLGRLDIGQGVVVRQKVVVAVEAMEGTDAMILRAGPLAFGKGWAGKRGGVLVKVAKPIQDHRLDLPTIGPNTMKQLHQASIPVVAIEAGGTIILDPKETCAMADRFNLVFIGCLEQDMRNLEDQSHLKRQNQQGQGHAT